jgi:hypothetical protein
MFIVLMWTEHFVAPFFSFDTHTHTFTYIHTPLHTHHYTHTITRIHTHIHAHTRMFCPPLYAHALACAGFSATLTIAVLNRTVEGLINANVALTKAYISDLTRYSPAEHRQRALAYQVRHFPWMNHAIDTVWAAPRWIADPADDRAL